MKKIIFLGLLIFGLSNLQAQEFFRIGAKAGVNFSNVSGDDIDANSRSGFHVGLVSEIPFSEKFYFAPEVLYSSQGFKATESIAGTEYEIKTKLDYIQIPLMLRYYVAGGFNLEAGPQVGFLTSAESKVDDEDWEDISEFVSGFEYGLAVGAGYKLFNGLFAQARYNLGLANVNSDEEFDEDKIRNGVLQLSIGFMF